MVHPSLTDSDARSAPARSRPSAAALLCAPAALLCAVAAAYATAFGGGWQFDDFAVIVHDPRVQSFEAWWASMPGIRPLLKLSYAANHATGLGLFGFHAVNVAIHALNALLAFALLARLGARLGAPRSAALLGALLFATHPVQTEAVTYLSGRSSALASTFALGAVLAFAAGRDLRRPALWLWLSPALLACSLAVKELAVALPAALLLTEALGRPFSWTSALRATLVHWLVVLLAAVLFLLSPYRSMIEASLTLREPLANALTHASATAWLAGQLLRAHHLVADPDLSSASPLGGAVALAGITLLAVASVRWLRTWPAACFAALWFLLWLAPQGWLIPRPEPASERQLYLALLGPAWLAGGALCRLWGRSLAWRAVPGALVVALVALTAARNMVYEDEIRFWSDVVAKAPRNARAFANLGHAFALACRQEEAEVALRRALELDPGHFRARVNLALMREGELPLGDGVVQCEGSPAAPPAKHE